KMSDNRDNQFNGGVPYEVNIPNITLLDLVTNNVGFDQTITIPNLPVGEYHIEKTLTINQDALNFYLGDFLTQSSCLPSYDDILQELVDSIDFDGCGLTYEDCISEIGTLQDLIDQVKDDIIDAGGDTLSVADSLATVALYDQMVEDCEQLNASYSPCEALEASLIVDITPGGQYATYEIDTNGIITVLDSNSIFFDPLEWDLCIKDVSTAYAAEYGTQQITIGGQMQSITQLTIEQYIIYQPPNIIPFFIACHPEYDCYQNWCEVNEASDNFDGQLYEIETYQEASEMDYIVSGQSDYILNVDPMFNPADSCRDTMSLYLNNINPYEDCMPISAMDLAAAIAYCDGNLTCPFAFGDGCVADN
ncbi:MAG: hypothetical protein AAFO82_24120, partial [Bacteroidota bacterium]